ncbi:MAG: hypothetical protein QOI21_2609 [Actinomycetota bacterium]|jgi:subtilisin family serine protease|nr:hypothetical protein [Actinomycetota bacterium]
MKQRSRIVTCALVTAVAAMTTTAAAATTANAPVQVPAEGAATRMVTLITGDRVRASQEPGGRWSLALAGPLSLTGLPAYSEFSKKRGDDRDQYLVPGVAADLVQSGVLDIELFNITGLIRQGYDDAKSATMPLLVQGGTNSFAPLAERTFAGLNLSAVAEDKKDATRFWSDLTGGTTRQLTGGTNKVWLNARVEPSLDVSVPQVGAPAAWQAGYTGKDVTVAVLDTGIDATHPDLAGKVAQAKDFSGTGDTGDKVGHGTHVASTIVGSGAASGGKYRGVAPDARLAVGKVLDDNGSGQLDDVIAGMEWAATEVKAKVVNMSLGAAPTDGTDPVSQVLNTLTRDYGTLFVVAAGNYPADEAVSSPASADAALAVGSVTKSGGLSDFSSRGPRVLDGAVKPEISAPGTDIVAAKASGTELGEVVDGQYVKASGTSMATPHVAGGAAILAGQHPDWTPDQLKASLVGTATPVGDLGVFSVGSGRMDLAHATGESVQASPATVNAYLPWDGEKQQKRTVTYRNTGTAPVSLALALDLGAPAGLVSLSASVVTVPAGGSTEVTLTVAAAAAGTYSGVLIASTVDGKSRVRTPVSVYVEPEKYDLTVDLLDRTGAPAGSDTDRVQIFGLDDRDVFHFASRGARVRLPAGRYLVIGGVSTPQAGKDPSYALVAHPELKLTADTELTLDARQAKRVSITVDQPEARDGVWLSRLGAQRGGRTDDPVSTIYGFSPRFSEVYVGSVPGVSSDGFFSANNLRLSEPGLELFGEGASRFEVQAQWLTEPVPAGTRKLPLASGLTRGDLKGKLVVLEVPADLSREDLAQRVADIKARGGAMVAVRAIEPPAATARGGGVEFVLPTVEIIGVGAQRFAELAQHGGRSTMTVRTSSRYHYELSLPETKRVPDNLSYPLKPADLAAVTMAFHGYSAEHPPAVYAAHKVFGTSLGIPFDSVAPPQAEQLVYYSPGQWSLTTDVYSLWPGGLFARPLLEGGKSYRIAWNGAVAGPGFEGTTQNELGSGHPWVWRTGNLVDVTIPLFADAAGHTRQVDSDHGYDSGSTELYRDGKLVGSQALPGRATFVVGYDEGAYRLATSVVRDQPWWPLSTKVSAAWTFRSGFRQGPGYALPLLAVRYAPQVDLRNSAPGGVDFTIPVTVPRQDGPADIAALAVEVSYDDGVTWKPSTVARNGSGWTASVTHPASGFASLRAKASDTEGNTVEQTVIRAYRIGG